MSYGTAKTLPPPSPPPPQINMFYPPTQQNMSCLSPPSGDDLFQQLQEKRNEAPMPWIGMYVAAASLVCSLAMAADVFHGFRHRKLWFPSKYFTLNAASLTLLAIAMKLPVDISSNMPGKLDQLAKISSTAFMSTTIGNFMPSLGTMDKNEILTNMIALAILVITILANVCIQLGTRLIGRFLMMEHIAVMFLMLVLLVILSFSALTLPTTKKHLQLKYGDLHKESEEIGGMVTVQKLKDYVKKYWMMAETSNPQFVMGRSVTCSALGAMCCLTTLILAEAELRVCLVFKNNPINLKSVYEWSIIFILVIQTIGVGVATMAPLFRWFIAIKSKCCSIKRGQGYKTELKIENYWIERLAGWRDSPLASRFRDSTCRQLVHTTNKLIMNFCIKVQIMIVTASKLVLLISSFLLSPLLSCFGYYKVLKQKLLSKSNASNNHNHNHTGSESKPGSQLDLSRFVLYLDGEEELPLQIMKNNRDAADHLIEIGKKKQPKYLEEILGKSTSSFMGVAKFDSNQISSLNSQEPPNCWTLPLVTLTSIAMALPNIEKHTKERLHKSINECLVYVRHVEKILDSKADLVNIINAAEVVWLQVDLSGKWLDEDLPKIALQGKTSKETLERLLGMAKSIVMEFKANANGYPKDQNPLNWPIKVIAANSMYRISQSVLLDHERSNIINQSDDERLLFEQLYVMIADILGACLTNLPRVIAMKCFCSAIEKREKSVRHAAQLLGETEEILKILQQRELPTFNPPDKAAYIDEWLTIINQQDEPNQGNPVALTSSSSEGTSFSASSEIKITVE